MASIPLTKHSTSHSGKGVGWPDNSSSAVNRIGPFVTASTTAGVTTPGSHVASPTICGYCGSLNHTTYNCPTCQEQQQQYHSNSGQQPTTSTMQGHHQRRAVCPCQLHSEWNVFKCYCNTILNRIE